MSSKIRVLFPVSAEYVKLAKEQRTTRTQENNPWKHLQEPLYAQNVEVPWYREQGGQGNSSVALVTHTVEAQGLKNKRDPWAAE